MRDIGPGDVAHSETRSEICCVAVNFCVTLQRRSNRLLQETRLTPHSSPVHGFDHDL
jgi:hypothetical protein